MNDYNIRTQFIDEINGKTILYNVYDFPLIEPIASAHVGWFREDFKIKEQGIDATIVGLYVKEHFQNQGIGSKLLERIISDAKMAGVTIITVDDMSKRYRLEHNIYTKFGFRYEDPISGPEMELKL